MYLDVGSEVKKIKSRAYIPRAQAQPGVVTSGKKTRKRDRIVSAFIIRGEGDGEVRLWRTLAALNL